MKVQGPRSKVQGEPGSCAHHGAVKTRLEAWRLGLTWATWATWALGLGPRNLSHA